MALRNDPHSLSVYARVTSSLLPRATAISKRGPPALLLAASAAVYPPIAPPSTTSLLYRQADREAGRQVGRRSVRRQMDRTTAITAILCSALLHEGSHPTESTHHAFHSFRIIHSTHAYDHRCTCTWNHYLQKSIVPAVPSSVAITCQESIKMVRLRQREHELSYGLKNIVFLWSYEEAVIVAAQDEIHVTTLREQIQ